MNYLIADVETYRTDPKNGKLLGVAVCSTDRPNEAKYYALQWYDFNKSTWILNPCSAKVLSELRSLLKTSELIGHNYAYDKMWLDHCLDMDTKWRACTRLMWHMSSAPSGPRPYGLKDAQVELLGWDKRGDTELSAQVEARGGALKKGDHYLADKELLGHYACLDVTSTALLYNYLAPFFDKHDYWWLLEKMVKYSWLLNQCSQAGLKVDVPGLEEQCSMLADTKAAYSSLFLEQMESYVIRLERIWREDRAAKYNLESARTAFLESWDKQKKFNLSSDKDKRELFYDAAKLKVEQKTDGGQGSTAFDALALAVRLQDRNDLIEPLETYKEAENAEALLNGFARPWLGSLIGDRLHHRYNPCGTVSYRLSGFKPYMLNPPFSELELMSCITCDEGWEGVHADFVSIEPAVTAHYSQDPSLLRVFRDGLGDVYLDLALNLFPLDEDLKRGYDPTVPITGAVKKEFKRQRDVAKTIQLAVQYTGTEYTVRRNLAIAGVDVSLGEAKDMVDNYWRHFYKVKVMNEALFIKFARDGYLRNVVGRVIQVPKFIPIRKKDGTIWEKPIPRYKDLPSRFISSSAHDILSFWVLLIANETKRLGMKARPMLIDTHDATSWTCPKEETDRLEKVFSDTLVQLNYDIGMSVPIKIDMKRFHTLAGLKGDE